MLVPVHPSLMLRVVSELNIPSYPQTLNDFLNLMSGLVCQLSETQPTLNRSIVCRVEMICRELYVWLNGPILLSHWWLVCGSSLEALQSVCPRHVWPSRVSLFPFQHINIPLI